MLVWGIPQHRDDLLLRVPFPCDGPLLYAITAQSDFLANGVIFGGRGGHA